MSGAEAKSIARGFTLLEGPRHRADGLYVSDFFSERILRFPEPGSPQFEVVGTVPGRPSGLGFRPDGTLVAVSMLAQQIVVVGEEGTTPVTDLSGVLIGPANDMLVDSEGRAYVGAFGIGEDGDALLGTPLAFVGPQEAAVAATASLNFPNGICLSPDGSFLYVAETYAGTVTRFARDISGALSSPQTFVDLSGGIVVSGVTEGNERLPALPDGLCADVEGGIWVADAKGHGARRYDSVGRQTDYVSSGSLSVYAVALSGPDRRTLMLCAAPANGTWDPATSERAELLAAEVTIPGVDL